MYYSIIRFLFTDKREPVNMSISNHSANKKIKNVYIDAPSLWYKSLTRHAPEKMYITNGNFSPVAGTIHDIVGWVGIVQKRFKNAKIHWIWDMSSDFKKKNIYANYKISRVKKKNNAPWTKKELKDTNKTVNQILELWPGIVQVSSFGHEADDVVVYLSRTAADKNVFISADKDLLQGIKKNKTYALIIPYKANTKTFLKNSPLMTSRDFKKNHEGLDVKDWWFVQTLQGDSADDVPGVKGLGPKKAIKIALWLKEQGFGVNIKGLRGAVFSPDLEDEVSKILTPKVFAQVKEELNDGRIKIWRDLVRMGRGPVEKDMVKNLTFREPMTDSYDRLKELFESWRQRSLIVKANIID